MKNLAFFIFLGLIFSMYVGVNTIYADTGCYKKATVNPGSIYYPVKRLVEKSVGLLKFNQQSRDKYSVKLFENRLNEFMYIADNQKLSQIEKSSSRATSQAGVLVSEVDKSYIDKVMLESMNQCLTEIQNKYNGNSAEWRFIQYSVDTISGLKAKVN